MRTMKNMRSSESFSSRAVIFLVLTLFFCAEAIGIPPKEKKTIAKRSSIIVRGERLEKG